jgi:hypothetical protein
MRREIPPEGDALRIVDYHEAQSDEQMAARIVRSVAALSDSDPLLLPPLNNAVDPEAIEALYSGDPARWPSVSFTYEGARIGITATGDVSVFLPSTPE